MMSTAHTLYMYSLNRILSRHVPDRGQTVTKSTSSTLCDAVCNEQRVRCASCISPGKGPACASAVQLMNGTKAQAHNTLRKHTRMTNTHSVGRSAAQCQTPYPKQHLHSATTHLPCVQGKKISRFDATTGPCCDSHTTPENKQATHAALRPVIIKAN